VVRAGRRLIALCCGRRLCVCRPLLCCQLLAPSLSAAVTHTTTPLFTYTHTHTPTPVRTPLPPPGSPPIYQSIFLDDSHSGGWTVGAIDKVCVWAGRLQRWRCGWSLELVAAANRWQGCVQRPATQAPAPWYDAGPAAAAPTCTSSGWAACTRHAACLQAVPAALTAWGMHALPALPLFDHRPPLPPPPCRPRC
jgi:hypothetical protein